MRKEKVVITPEQKEFQKVKRFIVKRFPGARTAMNSAGHYSVVYGENALCRTGRAALSASNNRS